MKVSDELHDPATLPPGYEHSGPMDGWATAGLDAVAKRINSIITPAGN